MHVRTLAHACARCMRVLWHVHAELIAWSSKIGPEVLSVGSEKDAQPGCLEPWSAGLRLMRGEPSNTSGDSALFRLCRKRRVTRTLPTVQEEERSSPQASCPPDEQERGSSPSDLIVQAPGVSVRGFRTHRITMHVMLCQVFDRWVSDNSDIEACCVHHHAVKVAQHILHDMSGQQCRLQLASQQECPECLAAWQVDNALENGCDVCGWVMDTTRSAEAGLVANDARSAEAGLSVVKI